MSYELHIDSLTWEPLTRRPWSARGLHGLLVMMLVGITTPWLPAADSVEPPAAKLAAAEPASLRIELGQQPSVQLRGRDARHQLVVTATDALGLSRDVTQQVAFRIEPAGFASIDATGLVTPLSNGSGQVIAAVGNVQTQTAIEVVGFDENQPVDFNSQVVPVFTKYGCNGGGCHGKASGQNGFKLSLLGFEPQEDYEHLVKESRGRRLFPAAPERSLLLQKSVNESPHGGGQRFDRDSHEYRLLRRWIAQGMPPGNPKLPQVVSIEMIPAQRQLRPREQQQLAVIAHYSDGSTEDVTRGAQFEPNVPEMAEVTATGLVRLRELVGDVAVMARYQGHVAVFLADIPLGAPPAAWPEPKTLVDEAVFAKLKTLGIPPSPPADENTFIRRLTLDLCGRLPTPLEVETFLKDTSANKRELLIDRLLDSQDYALYFASKWSAILRNRRSKPGYQLGNYAFHDWIRQSLSDNKPYDQFVHEIITASGTVASNPPVAWYREVADTTQRVEDAAQLFLGQRIQCARCHHHPFEKWSQRDYFQMSAFFNLVSQKEGPTPDEPVIFSRTGNATAAHPKSGESLKPAGLSALAAEIPQVEDPREFLADWMVQENNPFFAKSLVNRYWKHFFGRALVEPEDDLRVTNPPSNPELFERLSKSFQDSHYDLKQLIRTICNSYTYQLSSDAIPENLPDRRSYSRYYPKRLNAEVLLDAVDTVCGHNTRFDSMPSNVRAVALPDTSFNSYFLTVFGRPESTTACECERTQEANLAQSLHLLNSKEIQAKLAANEGRAAKWAAEPDRPLEAKVQELYLLALSRTPQPEESQAAIEYLQGKGKSREAFEDLIWSLVNSKEFLFNH